MEAAILSSSSGVFIFIPELVSELIFLDGQVKRPVERRFAASESACQAICLHFRFLLGWLYAGHFKRVICYSSVFSLGSFFTASGLTLVGGRGSMPRLPAPRDRSR